MGDHENTSCAIQARSGFRARPAQHEAGAAQRAVLDLDRAAVVRRHAFDAGQPQPGAAGAAVPAFVKPGEGLEYAFPVRLGDAAAVVVHQQFVAARRGFQFDLDALARVAHGVLHQPGRTWHWMPRASA
ncbi:hypothetical protein G6F40_014434 [Rhizopus arrhizus]|nr:hypothetical protein G6F40_014434 [Rhizopus arrhizus]